MVGDGRFAPRCSSIDSRSLCRSPSHVWRSRLDGLRLARWYCQSGQQGKILLGKMMPSPADRLRPGNALLRNPVHHFQRHLVVEQAVENWPSKDVAWRSRIRFGDRKEKWDRYRGSRPGSLLLFLAQVVPLHILPESLSHLGGRNSLSFPSTQNCGQGRVQFDAVASERTLLAYRQSHLPRTQLGQSQQWLGKIRIVTGPTTRLVTGLSA